MRLHSHSRTQRTHRKVQATYSYSYVATTAPSEPQSSPPSAVYPSSVPPASPLPSSIPLSVLHHISYSTRAKYRALSLPLSILHHTPYSTRANHISLSLPLPALRHDTNKTRPLHHSESRSRGHLVSLLSIAAILCLEGQVWLGCLQTGQDFFVGSLRGFGMDGVTGAFGWMSDGGSVRLR